MEKEGGSHLPASARIGACSLTPTNYGKMPARDIVDYIRVFNERFSRFLPDSEVCAFRKAGAGEYPISEEFAVLLERAGELRSLTNGLYDPAVGGLLEEAGYDAAYTMAPHSDISEFVLPKWELRGQVLWLDGPVVFDLGGMGKGYCIDRVADILETSGYAHYLVDGGEISMRRRSATGGEWRVALEYPARPTPPQEWFC